ncbi:hypothetical protein [Sandaracinus amylolyticus]|uniref:Uncharacterized protein n=1 Tax=Sandaracinus amylolyticus TaxID=927083 RepID=A0A0F6SE34_9BACT|nr:hypothetical protein [Sandaracinus amylolyticus]AKF04499.1 hypothetical protein DB32_001648 [Sandaracinus amylolyticus]
MGESASTFYVATEDGSALASALCALLGDERYASQGGRTQVGWWRRGAPGWTVMETSPPELLLERALGAREPRIASLARRLGRDVVYLAIHDGTQVLLVEARADGRWAATGAGDLSERDPQGLDREDPRAGRDGATPRFVVLDVGDDLRAAIAKGRGAIRAFAKLLGGAGADTIAIECSSARNAGARVRHAKYGEGTIVDEVGGDPPKLDVRFDDGRRTVLLARFVERLTP